MPITREEFEREITKEQEKELNKKLAEWAGLPYKPVDFGLPYNEGGYDLPDFTQSLDACFKWLVPKIAREVADIDLSTDREAMYKLFSLWIELFWTLREQPISLALALCLAIEKLVDKAVKDA